MHKNFALALALSGAVLLLFSCSKDSLVQKPLKEDIRGISSLDKVVMHHCESNTKLAFTADVNWKIENCPTWLSISGISNMQGKLGTTVLTFSAPPNLTKQKRSADIQFVEVGGDGKKLATLNVSQDAVVFELDVKDKTLNYNWYDHKVSSSQLQGDQTIKVNSNIFWKIEEKNLRNVSTKLFTYSDPEGENSKDIKVVPAAPNFTQDTTVVATLIPMMKVNGNQGSLKQIEGLAPINFRMSQNHLLFLAGWKENTVLDPDQADAAFFSELGPKATSYQSVTSSQTKAVLQVNSREPWVVSECPDWLQLSANGKTLQVLDKNNPVPAGEVQLEVSVLGANPELNTRRSGSFKLAPHHKDAIDANGNYIVTKPVSVSQAPFIFEVTTEDSQGGFAFKNDAPGDAYASADYADDQSYTFHVKTSGVIDNCEIYNLPSWLKHTDPVQEQSGSNWNQYKYVVSLKEQNLEFSKVSTSVSPVYVQQKASLNQFGTAAAALRTLLSFSQEAFAFDFTLNNTQTVGNVQYQVNNLPPALTASKLISRANNLFQASANALSGEWELGPGTSSWLRVYLQEQMNNWTGEGITEGKKGQGITLYFAPWDANQLSDEKPREGKLQVVSKRHLAKYGSYSQVPSQAKHEWTVIQRKFTYTVMPHTGYGPQSDKATFNNAPAYTSTFDTDRIILDVKCDGRWEIKKSELPAFLIPENDAQLSGDGETNNGSFTVSFRMTVNPNPTTKSGSIAVYCLDRNNEKKACAITQDAFLYSFTSTSVENIPAYVQPGTHYSIPLKLTQGAKIQVTDNSTGSWIKLSGESLPQGKGNTPINIDFHPDANLNTATNGNRSGTVTVTVIEPEGVPSVNLSFQQNRYLFSISKSDDIQFSELNDRTNTTYTFTSSGPWTLTPNKTWIHVNPSSGNGSETPVSVTVSADENTDFAERNDGLIDFTATLLPSANTLSLPVKQKAYQWGVTNLTDAGQFEYTFEPLEQKTITLAVKSSGAWSISNIPEWITVSPKNGNGNEDGSVQNVTITSTKNLETDAAKRALKTLVIAGTSQRVQKNPAIQKSVSVTQNPFIWNITGADNTLSWASALNTDTKNLSVQSSGAWYVRSASKTHDSGTGFEESHWTWIWNSGALSGNGTVQPVTITPALNNSFDASDILFYIESKEHKDAGKSLVKTVRCQHAAYVLEAGKAKLSYAPWNTANEAANQQQSLSVTSSTGNWSANADKAWISPAKSGASTMNVTVDNYNGAEARAGVITLRSTDAGFENLFRTVAVDQSGFVFKTTTTGDDAQTIATAGVTNKQINITSSAQFTVKSKPAFVSAASVSGNKLSFSVGKNTTQDPLSGNLVLESHGVELPITLNQYPYLFDVIGSSDPSVFSPKASAKTLSLTVRSNVKWSMTQPGWITVSGPSSGSTASDGKAIEYTVQIRPASDNQTKDVQSGSISFSNEIVASPFSFQVKQDGFEAGTLTLDPVDAYNGATMSRTTSFASSSAWSVSDKPDWVTLNSTSGAGGENVSLTITAQNYTGSAERSGNIVIKPTAYPEVSRTITVKQKAFTWTVSPTSLTFEAQSGQKSFTVDSPAGSTISVSGAWLSVDKTSVGAGSNVITVTAQNNSATTSRTATITVTTAGSLSKTISVTQKALAQ